VAFAAQEECDNEVDDVSPNQEPHALPRPPQRLCNNQGCNIRLNPFGTLAAKITANGYAPQRFCAQHYPSRQRDADGSLCAAAEAVPQKQENGRRAVQGDGNANSRAQTAGSASAALAPAVHPNTRAKTARAASAGGEPAAAASTSAALEAPGGLIRVQRKEL
jgi:hypothetical protein